MNKKILLLAAVIIAIVVIGGWKSGKISWPKFSSLISKPKTLTAEEAKAKVADYINNNLMQAGTTAEIKNISEEGGVFKIELTAGKQDVTAYMTKDGTKFFPNALDMEKDLKKETDKASAEEEPAREIVKSDKPAVELFVMSFCPFGNKAEDTLKPAYELLKNKVDFNFHYIVNIDGDAIKSLHGEKEVAQNEREACVLKNYGKDKWINFVTYVNTNCGNDGSCWETGAKNAGLDTAKISACVSSQGLDLMKADAQISNDNGATGSPTMFINGVETKAVYQYGNSEAYKQAICGAFNTAPSECSQTLSSATSTAEGGSCGN